MKKYQRIIASVLAVAISGSATGAYAYSQRRDASAHTHTDTAASVQTLPAVTAPAADARQAAAGNAFKDETVYVLCNNDASIKDIIVSDWLKNPGALSSLADCSTLTDIENVKGDETFTEAGTALNWNASGSDIYYKGKSDKELPVGVTMTYTLNGKRVDPDAIKGQSGHLVIEWHYENRTAVTRTVAGKSRRIAVPFLAASTAILDTNLFKNVNEVLMAYQTGVVHLHSRIALPAKTLKKQNMSQWRMTPMQQKFLIMNSSCLRKPSMK